MSNPLNLAIFDNTYEAAIRHFLTTENGVNTRIHCTNGTYVLPEDTIIPTLLAGFQFITDHYSGDFNEGLLIAVNSDESMKNIYKEKAEQAVRDAFRSLMENEYPDTYQNINPEAWLQAFNLYSKSAIALEIYRTSLQTFHKNHQSQMERAEKIGIPLAHEHPRRKISIVFYDKATPTDLYASFATDQNINPISLHKWWYGTEKDGPKIEGAEYFEHVIGIKGFNDNKPLCHDITVSENQSRFVKVVDLTDERGPTSNAYITPDGKAAYNCNDISNLRYSIFTSG